MKKLLTILLLITAISFYSQAQWVSIPDTNFGTWLNTNGFSSCMQGNNQTGWQMDTTCSAVVNQQMLFCSNSSIRDLTGITYFDNIGLLDCSNNFLVSLPTLPKKLRWLDCYSNQLTTLPLLPDSLFNLRCYQNQVSNLPELPDSLSICDISNNPIVCLPQLKRVVSLIFVNTLVSCVYNHGNVTSSNPNLLNIPSCQTGNVNGCTVDPDCHGLKIDSIDITNPYCPSAWDGSLIIHASGGDLPYTYKITGRPSQASNLFPNLRSGPYIVSVTDSNLCYLADSIYISETISRLTAEIVVSPGSTQDTLRVNISGGLPPYNVSWLIGGVWHDVDSIVTSISNSVVVWVWDSCNNYIVGDTVWGAGYVWPGDADDNNIADNNDLLPIGLAYGANGISRTDQSIGWYAHSSADWADTLPSGTNYKHIDCTGDGTINANDTLAIIQNFGLTHAKTQDERGWRMNDPALLIDLTPDTTQAGDTLYANIYLGDLLIPASNVYGLAFTLNYDAAVVDSSKTKITFGNSWLGNATDKISIAKDFAINGQLKCALTRIDHTTRSGNGQIGQAAFVITTDNINGKDLSYYQFDTWISDLTVIDNLGNEITVNQGSDSSLVGFEPTGISEVGLRIADLKIQPNPASDEVQVIVTRELIGGELKVLDVEGRVMVKTAILAANCPLSTTNFSPGIYFVQVITEKGMLTKRLVIAW